MKRLTAVAAAIGLVATGAVATVSGVASAADPQNVAHLAVTAPPASGYADMGAKKAIVTWDDLPTADPTFPAFDVYRVVADRNSDFITSGNPNYGPDGAERSKKVALSAAPEVTFSDLSAGRNYHFAVYAIDYTESGEVVVPPAGAEPNTPVGYVLAAGYNLSMSTTKTLVLSGNRAVLSGTLTTANGSPLPGRTITLFRDAYPFATAEADTNPIAVTTTAGGKWTYNAKPAVNTRYWARYVPATDSVGGWSKLKKVSVRKVITLHVKPNTTIRAGRQLTFRGKVEANPVTVAGLPICWQSTASGSWGGGNCNAKIRLDGTYVIRLTPGPDADGRYRVYSGLGTYYADSRSKPVKITVR